jgi:hypothetical protein
LAGNTKSLLFQRRVVGGVDDDGFDFGDELAVGFGFGFDALPVGGFAEFVPVLGNGRRSLLTACLNFGLGIAYRRAELFARPRNWWPSLPRAAARLAELACPCRWAIVVRPFRTSEAVRLRKGYARPHLTLPKGEGWEDYCPRPASSLSPGEDILWTTSALGLYPRYRSAASVGPTTRRQILDRPVVPRFDGRPALRRRRFRGVWPARRLGRPSRRPRRRR